MRVWVRSVAAVGVVLCASVASAHVYVVMEDLSVTGPTNQATVSVGQAVGGRFLFTDGIGPNLTLSGTATLYLAAQQYGPPAISSASLGFVPTLPQVTAHSTGSAVEITFNALPLDILTPDPSWLVSLEIGHWSWSPEAAAAGRTLTPSLDVSSLTYSSTMPGPFPGPFGFADSVGGVISSTYVVVPGPPVALGTMAGLAFAASRRKRPSQ